MDVKLLIIAVAALITCGFFFINLIFSKLFKAKDIVYKCRVTKNTRAALKLYSILLLAIPFGIAFIASIVTGKFIVILGFMLIWCNLIMIAFYNMSTRIVITEKGLGKVNMGGLVTIKNLYWDNIKSYKWNNNFLILNGIMDSGDNRESINIAEEDKEKVDFILSTQFKINKLD